AIPSGIPVATETKVRLCASSVLRRQNFPSKEEVGGAEKAAQEMAAQTAASNTPETSSE
ncbi:unnamed protein product, partial [Durusdinium trenchii]